MTMTSYTNIAIPAQSHELFFTTFVRTDEKMAEEIFGATKAKAMLQLTIVINYRFLDIPSISERREDS